MLICWSVSPGPWSFSELRPFVASGHMSSKFVRPQWGKTHEGDDHGDDDGPPWPRLVDLPSGYVKIAIENGHL